MLYRLVIKYVLFFGVLFSGLDGNAQDSNITIDRIINFSVRLSDTNVFSAQNYLNAALKNKKLDAVSKSKIEVQISALELRSGNIKQALNMAFLALKHAELSKDNEQLGMVYMQIGMIYKKLMLFLKAAHFFKLAEQSYALSNNFEQERRSYLLQAHVYTDYGKEKKNQYFLRKSEKMYLVLLKDADKKHDTLFQDLSYNNLANLYLVKYSLDSNSNWLVKCKEYAFKSIKLSKALKNEISLGVSFSNYAEASGLLGQDDSAEHYFFKANQIYLKHKVMHYFFYNCRTLIKLLIDNKEYLKAEKVLNDYLLQIQEHREYFEFKDYYELIARLEASKGKYKEAYEYRLLYSQIAEQMREDESAKELVRLQFLYDIEKKDKEISILNNNERLRAINIRNEKWIRNLLVVGITLLVFVLIFMYLRYREKSQLTKTIIQKNTELQRLSIVASNTSNAITVTNSACQILWVNDGFLKLYAWKNQEEIEQQVGLDYYNLCGLTRAEINQYVDEIKNTKRSVVFQSFKSKKSGEQSFIQTNLTPVFNLSGELDQMIFIDTDITELLEAREIAIREKRKAENALKTQELFLANVSHEIRTPMNGIIGLTRQLSDELKTEHQKDIAQSIHISAESLLHVVNDLLDVSKIRAGKMSIEKTSFSLHTLLENFKKAIGFRANEKGLKFIIVKELKLKDVVFGDPIRLNQVLLNLVGNAIKFTMKGEVKLEIKVESETDLKQELSFEISDTGIGIPANKLETVFDHFTQLEDHRTRTASGTGLGLGISKSLVEAMGGKLSLTSQEGVGTQIRFTLPFEVDQKGAEVIEKVHEVVLHKDLTGLKILLVEDNSINQKVIVHDLKKWKCNIDVVNDAFEAIECLKNKIYDVILMDYYMPRMDGIETTQYIRTKFPEPVRSIPIIAITASAMRGDNDKFIQAGMNDYISKPFNPENLYHLLLKWGFQGNLSNTTTGSISDLTSGTETSIDLSILLEKADGDENYLIEMYDAFLEMMPVYKEELVAHFNANNRLELGKSAHQILSPAKLFGLVKAIPVLEALQKNEGLVDDELAHLVLNIENNLDEAIQFIHQKRLKLS